MDDPTQLYRVTWSGECYVRATSWADALEGALYGADTDAGAAGIVAESAEEVDGPEGMAKGDLAALPWQSPQTAGLRLPDRTCGDLLGADGGGGR